MLAGKDGAKDLTDEGGLVEEWMNAAPLGERPEPCPQLLGASPSSETTTTLGCRLPLLSSTPGQVGRPPACWPRRSLQPRRQQPQPRPRQPLGGREDGADPDLDTLAHLQCTGKICSWAHGGGGSDAIIMPNQHAAIEDDVDADGSV